MSDDPGTNSGRPPRIAVALSIADEELRRRALHAVEGCSRRLALVADLESADVVITDHDAELDVPAIFVGDKQAIADAMRRACVGGLLPSFSAAKLRVAVEAVAHGLACTDALIELMPALEDEDVEEGTPPELTVREAEVLRQLIAGASNKEIARQLDISVHTAKFHVGSIITKLGANGRTDAVARALRLAHDMI